MYILSNQRKSLCNALDPRKKRTNGQNPGSLVNIAKAFKVDSSKRYASDSSPKRLPLGLAPKSISAPRKTTPAICSFVIVPNRVFEVLFLSNRSTIKTIENHPTKRPPPPPKKNPHTQKHALYKRFFSFSKRFVISSRRSNSRRPLADLGCKVRFSLTPAPAGKVLERGVVVALGAWKGGSSKKVF